MLNYAQKRTARLKIFLSNLQIHYYNSWKVDSLDNLSSYGDSDSSTDKNSSPARKIFSNAFVRTISSSSMFQYFTSGNNPMTNSAGSTNSQSQIFNNSTSNIINHQINAKLNPKTSLVNSLNNNNNNNNNNSNGTASNNNDLMIEDLMQLFSVVNIRIEKVNYLDSKILL